MPIRVLIVDDSMLMRRALSMLLASDPEIEVVGTARDGRAAIEQVAALRPDVITMDVRMPVMDGLEATEHIMAYYPTPILVLTASLSRFDIDITFKMLGLGALDVMEKPSSDEPGGLQQARAELIRRVKMLSRVRVVTHLRGRRREVSIPAEQPDPGLTESARRVRGSRPLGGTDTLRRTRTGSKPLGSSELLRRTRGSKLLATPPQAALSPAQCTASGAANRLIVIGASTGGPRVVLQILRNLPRALPAAVLLVQHIADGFTAGMVDWLQSSCQMPVHLGQPGTLALPGNVYVAPDNLHLLVDADGVLSLSAQPALLQRPSVDVTMQRAAEAYGSRAIGVLLTGMGRDGALGMAAIHRAAGLTIAQSGESCVVFGMPRAAIEARVVAEVLAPEAIPGRLQMVLRDCLVKG
ncbi:MAG: chemotaxis-specific protein-glutamate methyltransferase CheB [Chloroflexota bacterium]|nr:chemotaxis-specific protein-glutamate methyltransferase CheB [Chloroflexota bacterium]